jgi:mono/diheme cytochrome c family protein
MMSKIHTATIASRIAALSLLLTSMALTPALASPDQARDRDTTWTSPAGDASRQNPLASRTEVIAGGAKVFQQRCASCHSEDGRGTTKAPDLIQPDVQAQTDGVLFWKITTGNTHQGMPTFSFLPEPQRWQLVLHLRALAKIR